VVSGIPDGSWVWLITNMLTGSSTGIGLELVLDASYFQLFFENGFCQRGSADVSETDKEYFFVHVKPVSDGNSNEKLVFFDMFLLEKAVNLKCTKWLIDCYSVITMDINLLFCIPLKIQNCPILPQLFMSLKPKKIFTPSPYYGQVEKHY